MIEATVILFRLKNGGRHVTEKAFTSKWKKGNVGMARRFFKNYDNKGCAINYMLRCLSAPDAT